MGHDSQCGTVSLVGRTPAMRTPALTLASLDRAAVPVPALVRPARPVLARRPATALGQRRRDAAPVGPGDRAAAAPLRRASGRGPGRGPVARWPAGPVRRRRRQREPLGHRDRPGNAPLYGP